MVSKMPKWEYKVIQLTGNPQEHAKLLNKEADDGWELVSLATEYPFAYLKKRKNL
jgi:hypothetical protein